MAFPTSTVISVLALMFSFGTTFVSYRRTRVQDIQTARQELRKLLERLITIPRERLDAMQRHANDQGTQFTFDQLYNQENTLLSRQAAEIAMSLPPNLVSATEFYSIALALQNAYNLSGAQDFLERAARHATNFNDEVAAIRFGASLAFSVGKPDDGRAKWKQARAIFTKYPEYDAYTQTSTHFTTELQWAFSEAGSGQMEAAMQHLANADALVKSLPYSPGAEQMKAQLAQARAEFLGGAPRPPLEMTPRFPQTAAG